MFFVQAKFLKKKRKFLKSLERKLTEDIFESLLN